MLVLTRKRGEQVVIERDIVLTVLRVHGNRVTLAVTAPVDVSIHRVELHNRIANGGVDLSKR